ncbi:hypothetical protein EV363DRAFT_1411208 [Boletus edulis]|nr:hypothetical protein EV363DRAFT_1411208 [Boletus edulis]
MARRGGVDSEGREISGRVSLKYETKYEVVYTERQPGRLTQKDAGKRVVVVARHDEDNIAHSIKSHDTPSTSSLCPGPRLPNLHPMPPPMASPSVTSSGTNPLRASVSIATQAQPIHGFNYITPPTTPSTPFTFDIPSIGGVTPYPTWNRGPHHQDRFCDVLTRSRQSRGNTNRPLKNKDVPVSLLQDHDLMIQRQQTTRLRFAREINDHRSNQRYRSLVHQPPSLQDGVHTPRLLTFAPDPREPSYKLLLQVFERQVSPLVFPAGFYTIVHHGDRKWRTENKRSSVKDDVVEWNRPIPIPSDPSKTVCIEVNASSPCWVPVNSCITVRDESVSGTGFYTTLGTDTTAAFTLFPEDGDVVSPCSSILVTVKRLNDKRNDSSRSRCLVPFCSTTEAQDELGDATHRGRPQFACQLSSQRQCLSIVFSPPTSLSHVAYHYLRTYLYPALGWATRSTVGDGHALLHLAAALGIIAATYGKLFCYTHESVAVIQA